MSEAENELDNVNDTLNTDDPADNGGKRKRRLKGGHIALIVIGALLVLILAAVLTVTLIYHRYLNKINYTHDPYDPFDTAEIPIDSLPPEYFETPEGSVSISRTGGRSACLNSPTTRMKLSACFTGFRAGEKK